MIKDWPTGGKGEKVLKKEIYGESKTLYVEGWRKRGTKHEGRKDLNDKVMNTSTREGRVGVGGREGKGILGKVLRVMRVVEVGCGLETVVGLILNTLV